LAKCRKRSQRQILKVKKAAALEDQRNLAPGLRRIYGPDRVTHTG
jgi:hypothetical protein